MKTAYSHNSFYNKFKNDFFNNNFLNCEDIVLLGNLKSTNNRLRMVNKLSNNVDKYLPQMEQMEGNSPKNQFSLDKFNELNELDYLLLSGEKINIEKVNKILNKSNLYKQLTNDSIFLKFIRDLNAIQNKLKTDLCAIKDRQIERISKEYLSNNYEKIYKVNIKQVYSCIVGQRNLLPEMKKFLSLKSELLINLEKTKIFSVFNNKDENIYTSLYDKQKELKQDKKIKI